MRTKCLPIVLPPDVYSRLEERAAAEERDALQQARWLLRQVLSEPPPASVARGDDEPPTPAPAA